MGWKNVKEHYAVKHQVQVTSEGICIGSGYIEDAIVVGLDGVLKKRFTERSNNDLLRYQAEMDDDPETLRRLVETPDTFSASIPVYTYSGGDIIEERCEVPGYPNVTHAGNMMYVNTYSTDKLEVAAWAKENARIGIKWGKEGIIKLEKQLADERLRLAAEEANLAKLEAEFPSEQAD